MLPTNSLGAVFVFSFLVSFGAVVSPGPVTAAIVSEAPRQGWRVGPLVASGHSLLEFVMLALISLGLSAGMATPLARQVIAVGGGLLLIYIGGSYLLGAYRGTIQLPHPGENPEPRSNQALIGLGLITTLSNPFWYAWWVTVAAGYLSQAQELGIAAVGAFYVGHISADLSWDTLLSMTASAGRRLLTPGRYSLLIGGTGAFMVYLGVVFILSAFGG